MQNERESWTENREKRECKLTDFDGNFVDYASYVTVERLTYSYVVAVELVDVAVEYSTYDEPALQVAFDSYAENSADVTYFASVESFLIKKKYKTIIK